MSQRELAQLIGMEPVNLSKIENNKRPFPISRLPMLPSEIGFLVRNALVQEYAAELDEMCQPRPAPQPQQRVNRKRQSALAGAEEGSIR